MAIRQCRCLQSEQFKGAAAVFHNNDVLLEDNMASRWTQWFSLAFIITLLGSACAAFEDPSERATANAQNTAVANTVSAIDLQNETVVALQATANNVSLLEAQVTQIAAERNSLQATVNALQGGSNGLPNSSAANTIPAPPTTPSTLDGGAPAGPGPSVTPNAGQQTAYVDTKTAGALTSDFCAANTQSSFGMEIDTIYFVTVARNINRGVQYSLRITQDGQIRNLDTNFWTSDTSYETTCIYYGIDENNIPFEPGTYTVELLANNQPVAQSTFTIN
jgi:hypothetical protein